MSDLDVSPRWIRTIHTRLDPYDNTTEWDVYCPECGKVCGELPKMSGPFTHIPCLTNDMTPCCGSLARIRRNARQLVYAGVRIKVALNLDCECGTKHQIFSHPASKRCDCGKIIFSIDEK